MASKVALALLLVAVCAQVSYARPKAGWFDDRWNDVKDAANDVANTVTGGFNAVVDTAKEWKNKVGQFLDEAADAISNKANQLAELAKRVTNLDGTLVKELENVVDDIENKLKNELLGLFDKAIGNSDNPDAQRIAKLLKFFAQKLSETSGLSEQSSQCLVDELAKFTEEVANDGGQCVADMVNEGSAIVKDLLESVKKGKKLVEDIKDIVSSCRDTSCIGKAVSTLKNGADVGKGAAKKIKEGAKFVTGLAADIPSCAAELGSDGVSKVVGLKDTLPQCF